jgi:hypothetical protein
MLQRELVDNDGPQGKPASVAQALGRHLAMGVKDAFERLVDVLAGQRAQLVKEAAHVDPVVRVRVAPPRGCDHGAFFCRTALV